MANVRTIKTLPTAQKIAERYPLNEVDARQVERDRQEVKDILAGRDKRLLAIVGPCSAWPREAVLDYADRLRGLSAELRDSMKLVLRVYIQKPRTTRGWTGPVNQPDPFLPPDIEAGMYYARRLMVETVKMGLPIADEALFTHNAKGFHDLLSWVAIGARSSEDQEHRIWASSIDAPVGMKNPTSGCIPIGVNSVLAAQHGHTAVFDGAQVETAGNPYAHLVLRGGAKGPNYYLSDMYRAVQQMDGRELLNPAMLVDTSHDNCRINKVKDPLAQIDVVREVMNNLSVHPELQASVRGFLIESYLKTGSQRLADTTWETVDREGLSITDPCLGWDETRALLESMAEDYRVLRETRRKSA